MPVEHAARSYDVDLAALATAVGQRLHNADMAVTPHQSEQFARALQIAPPSSRTELYHTARAIFVTSFEQIEPFDRVFGEIFGAAAAPGESATVNAEAVPA